MNPSSCANVNGGTTPNLRIFGGRAPLSMWSGFPCSATIRMRNGGGNHSVEAAAGSAVMMVSLAVRGKDFFPSLLIAAEWQV
jgi:hypothetical protein